MRVKSRENRFRFRYISHIYFRLILRKWFTNEPTYVPYTRDKIVDGALCCSIPKYITLVGFIQMVHQGIQVYPIVMEMFIDFRMVCLWGFVVGSNICVDHTFNFA